MELIDTAQVLALSVDVYDLTDQVAQQVKCKQEIIQFLHRISSHLNTFQPAPPAVLTPSPVVTSATAMGPISHLPSSKRYKEDPKTY